MIRLGLAVAFWSIHHLFHLQLRIDASDPGGRLWTGVDQHRCQPLAPRTLLSWNAFGQVVIRRLFQWRFDRLLHSDPNLLLRELIRC